VPVLGQGPNHTPTPIVGGPGRGGGGGGLLVGSPPKIKKILAKIWEGGEKKKKKGPFCGGSFWKTLSFPFKIRLLDGGGGGGGGGGAEGEIFPRGGGGGGGGGRRGGRLETPTTEKKQKGAPRSPVFFKKKNKGFFIGSALFCSRRGLGCFFNHRGGNFFFFPWEGCGDFNNEYFPNQKQTEKHIFTFGGLGTSVWGGEGGDYLADFWIRGEPVGTGDGGGAAYGRVSSHGGFWGPAPLSLAPREYTHKTNGAHHVQGFCPRGGGGKNETPQPEGGEFLEIHFLSSPRLLQCSFWG